MHALCEAVALLLSKNMTCCAGPRCNATSSEHFLNTSHCTLHTPHSTLHTCPSSQLISSELFSSHFMSSHMSAKFFLFSFHLSTAQPFSSHRNWSQLISALLHVRVLLRTKKLAQGTSQYYFVLQSLHKALLCTTKLVQSTSQYYFVLRSLHKESFYTRQVLSQRSFYTQKVF